MFSPFAIVTLGFGALLLGSDISAPARIDSLPFVDPPIPRPAPVLNRSSPRDERNNQSPCKVYTVTLKAFTTYVIAMKDVSEQKRIEGNEKSRPKFRPYLRLERMSAKGQPGPSPVSDDNMHWNPKSETHLVFTCPADGTYRIVATMRKRLEGEKPKLPEPVPVDAETWGTMEFTLSVRCLESQREEVRGKVESQRWSYSFPEHASPDKDPVRGTPYKDQPILFETGHSYDIEMRAESRIFTPFIRLEDPDGRQVKVASSRDIVGNGLADEYSARMTYYHRGKDKSPFKIVATNYSGNPGKFHLTVRDHKPFVREFKNGPKEVLCDQLTHADPKDSVLKISPSKTYFFRFQAGFTYDIELRTLKMSGNFLDPKTPKSKNALSFDAVLRLEDDGGRELAFNDDEDAGVLPKSSTDSRITFVCQRDLTYRVIATSLDTYYEVRTDPQAGCGVFALSVLKRPTTHSIRTGIPPIVDRLTRSDPKDSAFKGSPSKVYAFQFEANNTYVIRLDSDAETFTGVLRLEDDHRRPLDFNSDITQRNRNARIVFRCERTGTYHISVANVQELSAQFTLSVELRK